MANVNIELGYKTLIWFNANPTLVLLAGQIVYLGQTGTYKIGDGVTQLSVLSFLGISSETQTLQNVTDLGNVTTNSIDTAGLTTDYVQLDLTATNTNAVGKLIWNNTDGTLDLGLKGGNVTLQIGQETVARVVNKTGTNITLLESNYQAVRVTGAIGQRPKVDLALANNDLNSATTLGLVTETILNNDEGFINTSGQVREINTTGSLQGETWADGDLLYLSGTIAGQITNIKPVAPIHTVIIGFVEYAHAIHGKIFVKVNNGYELEELHNVSAIAPNNNEVLTYDLATTLWKPKSVTTALGFTPYNATNPSGYITSSSLTGLVPYTGATANVDLGTFTLTTPTINGVSGNLAFANSVRTSGAVTAFTFTKPNNTTQTASTQINGFVVNGGTRQWATGAITTQSENVWGATTYSFVGASTITNAYGNVFNAPIAGTNCTITNRFAALFNGDIQVDGTSFFNGPFRIRTSDSSPVSIQGLDGAGTTADIKLGTGPSIFTTIRMTRPSGSFASNLSFYTSAAGAATQVEALRIFDTQNISIGSATAAGFKLDVNGTGRFQNNLTIGSTNQLIEIKQTTNAPTYTMTGASSSVLRMISGTRNLAFESYAVDQNYFSSTGARFTIRTTDANSIQFFTNNTSRMSIGGSGNLTFNEANNIEFGTTTGTKIGVATNQKLSFWNATPIVQPATGGGASTFVSNTSLLANDTATFDGYTIGQVVKALRNMGLLA